MGTGGQAWVSKICNVLDILPHSVSTIGPTMVGAGVKILNKGSQMTGEWYFQVGVCKSSISKEYHFTNL